MTTFYEADMKCAVCGKRSKHHQLASTNSFGWPDLDMRPAPMQRSTMGYWVVQCPGCGYCASDLKQAGPNARKTVEGDGYRTLRADAGLPELARQFLCQALVLEADGDWAGAGWAALHAAWDCDDEKDAATAILARNRSLALFERALGARQAVLDDVDPRLLTTDLLRRAGRFEEARHASSECLQVTEAEHLRHILEFQLHLIDAEDTACHTMGDAKDWKEGG